MKEKSTVDTDKLDKSKKKKLKAVKENQTIKK
jgi:hypothetical protein